MNGHDNDKVTIDWGAATVTVERKGERRVLPMQSEGAFDAVGRAWLRVGWDVKYVYSFTWLGRPMLQLPDDMIRLQEMIYAVKPDVIVETGVAHGGSLVFSAAICHAIGRGRVIGVEKGLWPENKAALVKHELAHLMSVVEGSSVDPDVVAKVKAAIKPGETVLVVLDSNHTYDHVLGELRAYGPLVTPGSWLIACDGIIGDLVGAPRSQPDWGTNNATEAAKTYAKENSAFSLIDPPLPFNESMICRSPTYWRGGFLQRAKANAPA